MISLVAERYLWKVLRGKVQDDAVNGADLVVSSDPAAKDCGGWSTVESKASRGDDRG